MKYLIIVGARGWGREVYDSVRNSKPFMQNQYAIKGFLDSDINILNGFEHTYPPILSSPEDYIPQQDDVFFVAIGDPKWRRFYVELLEKKGAKFYTIICEGAYVNPTAKIGTGSYIGCWTAVSDNVCVGKHVMIHPFCNIGHDVCIGDYSSLESYVFLGGYSSVGSESILHVKSSVIRHKHIGNKVTVGISSVVMRNISDGVSVFGMPARKIEI